jgi:ABC-type cobalt transport system substrate-binding protein
MRKNPDHRLAAVEAPFKPAFAPLFEPPALTAERIASTRHAVAPSWRVRRPAR